MLLLLRIWSWDGSIGTTWEGRRISGIIWDLMNHHLHFNKIPGWFMCMLNSEEHCAMLQASNYYWKPLHISRSCAGPCWDVLKFAVKPRDHKNKIKIKSSREDLIMVLSTYTESHTFTQIHTRTHRVTRTLESWREGETERQRRPVGKCNRNTDMNECIALLIFTELRHAVRCDQQIHMQTTSWQSFMRQMWGHNAMRTTNTTHGCRCLTHSQITSCQTLCY